MFSRMRLEIDFRIKMPGIVAGLPDVSSCFYKRQACFILLPVWITPAGRYVFPDENPPAPRDLSGSTPSRRMLARVIGSFYRRFRFEKINR